ncbi:MAG: HDOD domain-containing protein [gamma proteobacterium symbiont of Bathyaustriella thionipta]|nr:HDOD domain-containing protein [gamma proteobacterium symbiont of Bathyaustriella thionipta]MCU7951226.1 HDOD domain-containing protein [gamma proteobacterium symbiont of Bathyaustriella thionipta]MCU7952403.1 HDOD domain-containing protein [gamma proteobacterium symbiont of Bathyaustriella thionipta]MCU7957751.1 HDOD domain-containing protein [gamma proteobacterium symbiont of Bathyaustriella thionipta]MCU7966040.1 HDOD domain-containing protein [gamma proteobacterium symbiont of Bathyaustr
MVSEIGRFNIIRELGKGTQGVVHLAVDPVLQRNVAIKSLHVANLNNAIDTKDLLLKEARTISKMVHPNIVSIYEAGEDKEHNPYLVFEYVSGQLLSDVMKQKGMMSVKNTLALLKPAIEAISHADQQNIIHCDLKPANILINDDNVPKIMDFGIARVLSEQKSKTDGFFGTPRYMPPEYIREQTITASNDSYALGIILYEMLTGKSVFVGRDIKQIISKVLNESLPPPSRLNTDIDAQFESIILKAIDKKLDNRYHSTTELNAAIDDYLEGQGAIVYQSSKKYDATIEFLLRRMKRKKDFPALSESLFKINKIVDEDEKGFDALAGAIVEDFALTNKILKIVNSAYYRRSGGEVKTISRAVMMLGFDAIRSIAVSLILIDHLHDKSQAKQLKDRVISCLYSGVFAKNLADKSQINNKEEVFLSGIFYNLGKLLAIFCFNEESLEVGRLIEEENITEENAAIQVLGVPYHRLGVAIAKEWELPHYIVDTISPYNTKVNSKRLQLSNEEKMHAISSLSNELTDLIEDNKDSEDWRKKSVKLWRQYTPQLNLKDKDLVSLADQAKEDLIDLNSILNINMSKSSIIQGLEVEQETEKTRVLDSVEYEADMPTLVVNTKVAKQVIVDKEEADDPEIILKAGIDDIGAMLMENYSVTDVFRLCLEVMHRAFKFDHAVVCMVNNKNKTMEAKFGHGINNAFLSQFQFAMKYKPDVFHLALEKGIDVFIANRTDEQIIKKIPAWYQQIIEAESFIILPVMVKKKAIGLFYGDRFKSGELVIKQHELKLMQQLKYLASEALIKKYQK